MRFLAALIKKLTLNIKLDTWNNFTDFLVFEYRNRNRKYIL